MIKDMAIENKLQLIRDGLHALSSLKAFNYAFVGEKKLTSKLAGDSYDFDFKSAETSRGINFHFSPMSDRHGDLLGIIVLNTSENGRFAVGDYFVLHKNEKEAIKIRNSRRQTEEFPAWLNEKLSLIDHIFSNELRNILNGKSWESIPIDLYGYK